MIEKRAFHRVPFATQAILADNDKSLSGWLNDISFGGALVRLEHIPLPPEDSKFFLTLYTGEGALPLEMVAEVAYVSVPMVGLRFTSIDQDTRERLGRLMFDIESELYKRRMENGAKHLSA
ncbi:MAG: PilZ domain-containing protein [Desulfuromonadales bacterium]